MFKRLQGLVAGVIIGALLMGSVALAASSQNLQAYYNFVKRLHGGKKDGENTRRGPNGGFYRNRATEI